MQAQFRALKPKPCKGMIMNTGKCNPASGHQAVILYLGLCLIAFGTSGVKAALPALGADQFDEKNPREVVLQSKFFNWFLFSLTVGASIGVTFLVWISTNLGWNWGFGISTISVLFAVVFLSIGRSFYRNNVPGQSPIIRILQVCVATIRNWKHPPPNGRDELHGTSNTGELLRRTDQFRFLDRAAIINPNSCTSSSNPWRTCTVTQVEETKILVRMLPIILSTVFMNVCLAQLQTFSVHQATTMNTHLAGDLHVPPSSLPIIPLLFMAIFILLYDSTFVPFMRRLTGVPTGIRHLQHVGVGLVLSAVSMAVAGVVETRRKSGGDSKAMSVFWLGFQYGVFGAADMFTLAGMLEFFYAEAPARMKVLWELGDGGGGE
ncbi:hypothetical protein J5N97_008560 [Dioscorea zingiberensis]|uniref:Uncharacterized protein n=1 Tax=Dioscorea zingiberensis TaxID=325984 RepID=A0A9D5CXV9_9LILI|nr:hypothetical protein J5N97_008560 [Dioscorea zingiberensis]